MPATDFDDLVGTDPIVSATPGTSVPFATIGTPIVPAEVRDRLSSNLYLQLSDGDDAAVIRAAERAVIHTGAIAARLGSTLDLDETVPREIVLLMTIYELHMALGHEAAGKEYRIKAKDLIVSAFGNFPETGSPAEAAAPAAAVVIPRRRSFP
jgi:hypothetical protein